MKNRRASVGLLKPICAIKIEGREPGGEGTIPVATACPEAGKQKCGEKKETKKEGGAQPPREPQTRASPEPLALTTQPAPNRRGPLVAETARLLKDHEYLAGEPETRRGSRSHAQGVSLGGKQVPGRRQRGPVARTQGRKTHFGDTEDVDTRGIVPGP